MSKMTPNTYMQTFFEGKDGDFVRKMEMPVPYFSGREKEINQILECLCRARSQSLILVGEPGCGKTQLVRKAAQKTRKFGFFELDLSLLVSGCTLIGMVEEKINDLLEYVSCYNRQKDMPAKIVLFVDEVHALWGLNGSAFNGTASLNDILKPYLADGRIIIVGATTPKEFKRKVLADKAFMRRFSVIKVEAPEKENTLSALREFAKKIEKDVDESLLEAIYAESLGLSAFSSNPDAALEILDRCNARNRYRGTPISVEMIQAVASDIHDPFAEIG